MGEVYAADDTDLDRRVALKVLRPKFARSSATRRFLREAKAMARLNHPNVMTIYEVDSRRGLDFIAMEFVEGVDFRTWAADQPDVLDIAAAFCAAGRGVAAAHDAGLIHRDLKPANILKADDGRVLVADFGIARLDATGGSAATVDGDSSPPDDLTSAGSFLGTPAYAAPEQFSGGATPKSDQYALCASMYTMIYGEPPHGRIFAELAEAARVGVRAQPGAAKSVPAWLWKILARGLEPNPDDRFSSVAALVAALAGPRRRSRAIVGIAALAVVGGVLAVGRFGASSPPDCTPAQHLERWQQQRGPLEQGFLDNGRETDQAKFGRFATAMDAYAESWDAGWLDACEATHVHGLQGADALATRMDCLTHRAHRASQMIDSLATSSDHALEWALDAVHTLPSIDACADSSGQYALPEPEDKVRDDVEALRSELVELEARLPIAPLGQAMRDTKRLVDDATRTAFAPVVAEALSVRGATLASADHPVEARAALEEALSVAEQIGYRRVHAHSAVALVGLDAELWDDPSRFDRKVRRARSAVEKYPFESLATELDQNIALGLRQQGKLAEAQALLTAVRERRLALTTVDLADVSDTELELGVIHHALGNDREATAMYRSALERLVDLRTADTRDMIIARDYLARALRRTNAWEQARTHTDAIASYLASDAGPEFIETIFASWSERAANDRAASISVAVTDSTGRSVPEAEVLIARSIEGDGMFAAAGELAWWVRSGASIGTTDESGLARISHPEDWVWVVAEDASGRSWPKLINGANTESVELQLRPWTRIEGRVDMPVVSGSRTAVHIFPRDLGSGRDVAFYVTPNADGEFVAPRLAAGPYIVGIVIAWAPQSQLIHRFDVTTAPGVEAMPNHDFVIPTTVLKVTKADRNVGNSPEASVFVVSGSLEVKGTQDLDVALVQAAAQGPMAVGDTVDGVLELRGLPLGDYTLCVSVDRYDEPDPQSRRARAVDDFHAPVQCDPLKIDAKEMQLKIGAAPTTFGLRPPP